MTLAAYLTSLPLLFPPLGPSAFILFHTPMSERASPRNIILSHGMALVAGVLSWQLMTALSPHPMAGPAELVTWPQVGAIAVAMGSVSAAMIFFRCDHPPAAATALLGAMGVFENATHVLGLLAAVGLLVLEAFLLNRVVGGLPYPVWRADPKISSRYAALAGIPGTGNTFWQQLASRIYQHRHS
jgi:CBS-domain-containing membrane protein